jgi:AraC-like DNA-binding protein
VATETPEPLTLSIAVVRSLVEAVESMGVSRDELLQGSRLMVRDLSEPRFTITSDDVDLLIARAIVLTDEPALGLKWGKRATFATFGAVGNAFSVAKTFRAGVGLVEHYWALFISRPVLTVYDDEEVCRIKLHGYTHCPIARRVYLEAGAFALTRFLRLCVGVGGVPLEIGFDYPEPNYGASYRAAFGCAVVFDRASTELSIASKHAHQAHFNHATELDNQLRTYADRLLAERHDSDRFSTRVLSLLRAVPDARSISMEDAASQLGLSERTLRRRLQTEQTSFPQLSQQVFREQAEAMLRDPARSVKEVAYALGFGDPSAFHRAVRRSTGKAPSELRAPSMARASQDALRLPARERTSDPPESVEAHETAREHDELGSQGARPPASIR